MLSKHSVKSKYWRSLELVAKIRDLTKLHNISLTGSGHTNNGTRTKPIEPVHRNNTPYELLGSLTREVFVGPLNNYSAQSVWNCKRSSDERVRGSAV